MRINRIASLAAACSDGAYGRLYLTPRRYQSGELDRTGPQNKLTNRNIDVLRPAAGRYTMWDTDVSGLEAGATARAAKKRRARSATSFCSLGPIRIRTGSRNAVWRWTRKYYSCNLMSLFR
jgi:hypothetical protein